MIEIVNEQSFSDYDQYLNSHIHANYGLDRRWSRVIQNAYGKKTQHLMYRENKQVRGIAALSIFRGLSGVHGVGMPYMDFGGLVCDDVHVQTQMINAISKRILHHKPFELRCKCPLINLELPSNSKRAMLLPLSELTEEILWKAFDAKVRNQVRKAEKEGVSVVWGGSENLEKFYPVFARNMRDLGSPVHAKNFFVEVMRAFPEIQIGLAIYKDMAIGGLVRFHWHHHLILPWASTLREYRHLCPNNVLYWSALQYAFSAKCSEIDFGRSTVGEGTYKFKKQWLARENPLPWYPFDAQGCVKTTVEHLGQGKAAVLANGWAKLPLGIANVFGPLIRGHIPA